MRADGGGGHPRERLGWRQRDAVGPCRRGELIGAFGFCAVWSRAFGAHTAHTTPCTIQDFYRAVLVRARWHQRSHNRDSSSIT